MSPVFIFAAYYHCLLNISQYKTPLPCLDCMSEKEKENFYKAHGITIEQLIN